MVPAPAVWPLRADTLEANGRDLDCDLLHLSLDVSIDFEADANGIATLRQSYAHLCPSGRLVVYGFHTMIPKGRGVAFGSGPQVP